jgi:hypothetical protein
MFGKRERGFNFLFQNLSCNGKREEIVEVSCEGERLAKLQVYAQVGELQYFRSYPLFVSHPTPLSPPSEPFSAVEVTVAVRYSCRREIDVSPWIYGSITGDFETLRRQTVGKK